MGIEENKKIAKRFMQALAARDMDTCRELMWEDGTWWMPKHLTVSGTYKRDDFFRLAESDWKDADEQGPMTLEFGTITAEGNNVCIQSESHSNLPNGLHYNNQYHHLLILKDGRIWKGYEYLNSQEYIRCFPDVEVDLASLR